MNQCCPEWGHCNGSCLPLTSAGGTSILLRDLEDVYFPFPPIDEEQDEQG